MLLPPMTSVRHRSRRSAVVSMAGIAVLAIAALGSAPGAAARLSGIHRIQHVVMIIQENRSFDSYFGTFPGADGIPRYDGIPSVCVPDPATRKCVAPYVDHQDSNGGGPHTSPASTVDVNGGQMNGFLAAAEAGRRGCLNPTDPICTNSAVPDVMGYHTGSDIPNYWAWAKRYVLQDHLFESVHSWSLPSHLFFVSGWSATCVQPNSPMSCSGTVSPIDRSPSDPTPFAWTDLTYLLAKNHVRWAWYLDHGAAPPVLPGPNRRRRQHSTLLRTVPKIWNVLPGFTDVHTDGQLGNIQTDRQFFAAARAGTLPQVSWLLPDGADSEHPPALVSTGQSYVTQLVDAVMRSPDWSSTAIFITWDDWGGFYDQVVPPTTSTLGYGIRVPGLVISPYARAGFIDHQTLSFDAYLAFIEDDFLGGQRLNPLTDGRPDSRPVVVENLPGLGSLTRDFNFSQAPRPPLILPVCPGTTLTGVPANAPYCSGPMPTPTPRAPTGRSRGLRR
ncbi:MAG TPA: alkaline phosphatase family protein [Verrucomicrobiae bacterium]|nr:alkaline phosphatase family protein [Verrucomicrobiae bacterium]